jgi:hypothetical protein
MGFCIYIYIYIFFKKKRASKRVSPARNKCSVSFFFFFFVFVRFCPKRVREIKIQGTKKRERRLGRDKSSVSFAGFILFIPKSRELSERLFSLSLSLSLSFLYIHPTDQFRTGRQLINIKLTRDEPSEKTEAT